MQTITLARARYLFASLMLLLALTVPVGNPLVERAPSATIDESIGRGPGTLACFGCLVGGATILLGGPTTWLMSLMAPGGVYIVAGCVTACASVVAAQ